MEKITNFTSTKQRSSSPPCQMAYPKATAYLNAFAERSENLRE